MRVGGIVKSITARLVTLRIQIRTGAEGVKAIAAILVSVRV